MRGLGVKDRGLRFRGSGSNYRLGLTSCDWLTWRQRQGRSNPSQPAVSCEYYLWYYNAQKWTRENVKKMIIFVFCFILLLSDCMTMTP